jgi:dihydroorotate dehydrogenase (NAD+) catalytic subunit
MVWQVASQTKIPVIGIGGITSAEDVMDFLVAGASVVQVGTANIVDPDACIKIIDQIPKLLEEQKIKSVKEVINTLKYH